MLPVGLEIDEAVVSGNDVQGHTDPFFLVLGSDATATVRVSCESIQRYLSTLRIAGLRDVVVETDGGLLKVAGTVVVLVPIRAVAACSLVVRDSVAVDLVLESAEPSAAAGLIEKQLKGINPIVDVSKMNTNLVIESVEVEGGWVVLHGVAG